MMEGKTIVCWVLGEESAHRSAVQYRPGEATEDPSADGKIEIKVVSLYTS